MAEGLDLCMKLDEFVLCIQPDGGESKSEESASSSPL